MLLYTFYEYKKCNNMEAIKQQIDIVLDGFFYFFGFIENPAQSEVNTIMHNSPAEKIKADIKRMNKDYRKKYSDLRKEVLCLEW